MNRLKVSGRNRERMGSVSIFPYHYGKEAEAYTFYRIPKVLFTEPVFSGLSTDAKLLYGLLIDRMQISVADNFPRSMSRHCRFISQANHNSQVKTPMIRKRRVR